MYCRAMGAKSNKFDSWSKTFQGALIVRGKHISGGESVGLGYSNRTGIVYNLNPRYDLKKHSVSSNDCYDWGKGCSYQGGLQLALAMCAWSLSGPCDPCKDTDKVAVDCHRDFYEDVVVKLPHDEFSMSADDINKWIKDKCGKLPVPQPRTRNYMLLEQAVRRL